VVTQTIDYTYDPLQRLTLADYSGGDSYSYTYDAVGNRLSQDDVVGGQPTSLEYTYDEANRLTAVGSVSYTWDANGNLLNDGTNTYTYDSANRLTAVTGGQNAVSYVYDGLGNRLQQTANGTTITYVNDLNGGLTQVLSDGTNTYLYGNGRTAQAPITNPQSTIQYFLGDALGSVRQMADESGEVVYAASYDPYGQVLSTNGDVQTSYGYVGENMDSYIKLIDLRSRQYSPEVGRFLTQDSWQGDYNRPLSLNRWDYAEGNPISRTDPGGYNAFATFSSEGQNTWSADDMRIVEDQTADVARAYADAINSYVLHTLWDPCNGIPFPVYLELHNVSPTKAFYMIHGGPIHFEKGDEVDSMGFTKSRNLIRFREHIMEAGDTQMHYFKDYPNVVTHEIGHAFDKAVYYFTNRYADEDVPQSLLRPLEYDKKGNPSGRSYCDPNKPQILRCYGYAGGRGFWQFGQGGYDEEFADMFVGWTYQKWDEKYLPQGSPYANRSRDMTSIMISSLTNILRTYNHYYGNILY
jgi:RHS repeat-associated protein